MPKIDSDDLTEIFGDDVMDSVTIAGNPVKGLFFAPYERDLGISGNKPSFRCNPADVVGIVRGAVLVFNAVNYRVSSREDENAGTTTLILKAT